jgi:hypothetical protein
MNNCHYRRMPILLVTAFLLSSTTICSAGWLNVNVDIPGIPAPPPPAVIVEAPAPVIIFEQPPQLLYSAELGYYVAVNTPHEMVFIDNTYYIHRNGYWLAAPSYEGPWVVTQPQYLPLGLVRFNVSLFRRYRDNEYRNYRRDPAHYQGRILDHHAGSEHRATEPAGHRGEARPEDRRMDNKEKARMTDSRKEAPKKEAVKKDTPKKVAPKKEAAPKEEKKK